MSHLLHTQSWVENAKKIIHSIKDTGLKITKKIGHLSLMQKVFVSILALLAVWFISKKFLMPSHQGRGEVPVIVSSADVTQEKWSPYIEAIGGISAVNAVTLTSEVSGLITQIYFNSGDHVKAGDVLVLLNDEVEQADLKKYEAQVELAQVTLQRSKELTKTNAESKAEYDKKTATLKENEALVAQAKAVISKKRIKAPFQGDLGISRVDLGQYVQPGTPIVTLTDLTKLYVDLTLPEHHRPSLTVGQKVIVRVDAFPDHEFEAVLTTIDPQIDEKTRAIKVQAAMSNGEKKIFPGMYVQAKIIIPEQKDILIIPETAVDYELHGTSVFLIEEEKNQEGKSVLRVHRQYVKTGERRNGSVEITEGLKVGNRVVLSGQLKLTNGALVVINNQDALPTTKPMTNY